MLFKEFEIDSGAVVSPCKGYRYSLWRIWDKSLPLLGYVLLNPSKADANSNDPTILRLVHRARILRFGGILVVNLFAYRATNPQKLYDVENPIGSENDSYILQEMRLCEKTICGWGRHGKFLGRAEAVFNLLKSASTKQLYALSVNADGSPEHPLYLPYWVSPVVYNLERK